MYCCCGTRTYVKYGVYNTRTQCKDSVSLFQELWLTTGPPAYAWVGVPCNKPVFLPVNVYSSSCVRADSSSSGDKSSVAVAGHNSTQHKDTTTMIVTVNSTWYVAIHSVRIRSRNCNGMPSCRIYYQAHHPNQQPRRHMPVIVDCDQPRGTTMYRHRLKGQSKGVRGTWRVWDCFSKTEISDVATYCCTR